MDGRQRWDIAVFKSIRHLSTTHSGGFWFLFIAELQVAKLWVFIFLIFGLTPPGMGIEPKSGFSSMRFISSTSALIFVLTWLENTCITQIVWKFLYFYHIRLIRFRLQLVSYLIFALQYFQLSLFQLLKTADDVSKMQEELETMRPLLEEATVETMATMEKIAADTVSVSN